MNSWSKLISRFKGLKGLPTWAWGVVVVCVFLLLALLAAVMVFPSTQPESSANTSAFGQLTLGLSVALKLGFVILLIYVSLNLFQRWRGGLVKRPVKRIEVLESAHLSPRQALHLVKVGEETLLIGATDQTLSMLTAVTGLPEDDEKPVETQASSHFGELLTNFLKQPSSDKAAGISEEQRVAKV